jgi:hypothetical protein
MTLKNILVIGLCFTTIISCKNDLLDVDSSNTSIDIEYINLDSILVNSHSDNLIKQHHLLQNKISDIYSYQLGYCLQIGKISDTAFVTSISQFTSDPGIKKIENSIQEKFKNLTTIKSNIKTGFQNLKYHFPKGKIPEKIIFMNSLFQSNAFSTETEIGIGLERYLGTETDVIKELPNEPFYQWIKDGFDPKYIERDALCSWIMTHYVEDVEGTLAENIIRWGKIIYLTEAAFPNLEENVIMRYSKEDYQWALENESTFWKYLINEKMLFKSNDLDKANLLNDAPFTIGLSEKSPDRFAQFLGWQMVRNFMSKNEMTLEKLLDTPYNNILQEYEIED